VLIMVDAIHALNGNFTAWGEFLARHLIIAEKAARAKASYHARRPDFGATPFVTTVVHDIAASYSTGVESADWFLC